MKFLIEAENPVYVDTDPDFEALLLERANNALESGEWDERMAAHAQKLQHWAKEPVFPTVRRMAETPFLRVTPTAYGRDPDPAMTPFPNDALDAFVRVYVFFNESNDVERRFAAKVLPHLEAHLSQATVRPIVTGGSVTSAESCLQRRVWADQGANLTRRLGLPYWPAIVKLTAHEITVYSPVLNPEGEPTEPIPGVVTHGNPIDLRAPDVK